MRFKHKKTGAIVEPKKSMIALYKKSNVFEEFAAVELSKDDFTKAELQTKLDELGITYHDKETKQELLDKLGEG